MPPLPPTLPALDLLAQGAGLLLCAVILVRTEPAINRMSRASPPFMVRLAFALLATGAVAGILAILAGAVPSASTLFLTAGTAALAFCERRIRLLTGQHHRKGISHAQR